jgi:hypothetical protein
MLRRTCITVLEFLGVVSRSLVLRSDKVIAYLVRVGIISGIDTRVMPAILAQSSYRRVKGSSRLSRVECSTSIRSRRSSYFLVGLLVLVELLDLVEARETLLELNIAPYLEEEELRTLVERKSTPKFFRVFAMSTKLTDFVANEEGTIEC